MKIYHNLNEWQHARREIAQSVSIGFVPTMGNLHIGHESLFLTSVRENDCTIASLFINPTQFNQSSDFAQYPRTLDDDLEIIAQAGVDYCFIPDEHMMYPDGYRFQIDEIEYSNQMEGLHRPGHFKGVLTVVMKLLHLAKPHRAYFGEKDYMQQQLIRDMVNAFFLDIEIKTCPTIREVSGLACSSRNNRLSAAARKKADQFAKIFHDDLSCNQIVEQLTAIGVDVEYVEEYQNRRFAAVVVDGIRLIDNTLIT